jgi:hypothetical protein
LASDIEFERQDAWRHQKTDLFSVSLAAESVLPFDGRSPHGVFKLVEYQL